MFVDCTVSSYTPAVNVVIGGIAPPSTSPPQSNYTGQQPAPDVEYLNTFPTNLQAPSQIDALAQSIIQNADAVVITPTPPNTPPYLRTATGADLTPLGMSSTNPLTVVMNCNLYVS